MREEVVIKRPTGLIGHLCAGCGRTFAMGGLRAREQVVIQTIYDEADRWVSTRLYHYGDPKRRNQKRCWPHGRREP